VALIVLSGTAWSQPPTQSAQTPGLRENPPRTFALKGAKIYVTPDRVIESGTLVVEGNKIVEVGAEVEVPTGAIEIDVTGKILYPGFIDAYREYEIAVPEGLIRATYWNTQVQPELAVADALPDLTEERDEWLEQGIVARLIVPAAGIIRGTSSLVMLADDPHSALVARDVAQHMRITVPFRFGDRERNPTSPMGAVSLVRQSLYDARWYADAWDVAVADPTVPRPEQNASLAELADVLDDGAPVIIDTSNEVFVLRADRVAREFGLRLIIKGSGNEFRRLDEIVGLGRPLIIPLALPQAPDVSSPEKALDASLESLMYWDLAPDNPRRLAEAGAQFAFCTEGLSDAEEFLDNLRLVIKRGLAERDALAALTTGPAELFGVTDSLGTLERGKLANIVVADGPLADDETAIVETWVNGTRHEHSPPPLADVEGTWTLATSLGELSMKVKRTGRRFSGTIARPGQGADDSADDETDSPADADANPTADDQPATAEPDESEQTDESDEGNRGRRRRDDGAIEIKSLALVGSGLSGHFDTEEFGVEGIALFSLVIRDGSATGQLVLPDGSRTPITATLAPAEDVPPAPREADADASSDEAADEAELDEGEAASEENDDAGPERRERGGKKAIADKLLATTSCAANYPLGTYGRTVAPEQPARVIFRDATVWTCGPQGKLDRATVVIGNGKVVQVTTEPVEAADGDLVVDATGLHITPGIIDCHSHMATDGGVNEVGQAVTAEVRIGDFIDCDDITIYRHLAGGVTAANILHGSANPIGGQNQVIKLRWGSCDDGLKMVEAPPGIKFALGENVKQSNMRGEASRRYPQTRMGVEQLIYDTFQAAQRYHQRWQDWESQHRGLPPRRDLELDAISEIIEGRRWIHCHSYRQDEILALMRLMDQFGVTIGSLQHVLEGYKVADEMARHGVTGSAFSDWWAYKFEVYDAIPYAGALMHRAGVVVSFNSDDAELARHLNHEAAKAVKYGGVPPEEALKFVTINPAKQLRIDTWVGSLEPGKHADLVVWSGDPLSTMARCEQTWIDGRKYFDRADDVAMQQRDHELKQALIQKVLATGATMSGQRSSPFDEATLWPRYDEYCGHAHDHEDEAHDHEE
jgi:N-acetylglucosamine-6-phosphate deacetylase